MPDAVPQRSDALKNREAILQVAHDVLAESADASQAEAALLATYPDAGLQIAAGLGTKVAKGEMTWG